MSGNAEEIPRHLARSLKHRVEATEFAFAEKKVGTGVPQIEPIERMIAVDVSAHLGLYASADHSLIRMKARA